MSDKVETQISGQVFKKGEVIFREGDPGEVMFVIRSGSVKISIASHGVERVLAVLGAGDIVGEMALLNSMPRTATAIVEEDAELMAVDAYTFEEMIIGRAEIALRLIRKLAVRLNAADSMISVLIHRDPTARFALGLKRGAALYGRKTEAGIQVYLSVQELADQVGITLEEAKTVIQRLSAAGIAQPLGNDLLLKDSDKLDQFVEFVRTKPA